MPRQKEYNGWPSYAAWNVNLWLTNDERSYMYIWDNIQYEVKKDKLRSDMPNKARIVESVLNKVFHYFDGGKTGDGIPYSRRSVKMTIEELYDEA